jgi:bromodomain adjacent to zinc finger domain protein 1A
MPLLHKQQFTKKEIQDNLDPEQDVFYSKLTQEIFTDYDEYFERTILCNSLVWTCMLTGKGGLTYAEALESEQKARKMIASFPDALKRAVVYLITLTKRGNIKEVLEDIFSYCKDRYFIGEKLLVFAGNNHSK